MTNFLKNPPQKTVEKSSGYTDKSSTDPEPRTPEPDSPPLLSRDAEGHTMSVDVRPSEAGLAEPDDAEFLSRAFSCESLTSNWSKQNPVNFNKDPRFRQKTVSQGPSWETLMSDQSIEQPVQFSKKPLSRFDWDSDDSCSSVQSDRDLRSTFFRRRRMFWRRSLNLFKTRRRLSRAFSCESLKSNWSKQNPVNFNKDRRFRQNTVSQGPSWETLMSDQSIEQPVQFSKKPLSSQKTMSEDQSCKSLRSYRSIEQPPELTVDSLPWLTAGSPGPGCMSLKSDGSIEQPPDMSMDSSQEMLHGSNSDILSSISLIDLNLYQITDFELRRVTGEHRRHLLAQCETVSEGLDQIGVRAQLNSVFSELFITENLEDCTEVQYLETQYRKRNHPEASLRIHDLFRPPELSAKMTPSIRTVLTLGVAGVGKTFSVLKFCLDWAVGLENQDVQLVVPLSFREMNLVSREHCSLMELIKLFNPSLRQLDPRALTNCKVLFICDGLDESRLPLDFKYEVISEVTQRSEVSVLLVNLIRGDLLPHAHIWITSRPAAANQIPAQYVARVTEVRGFFTDEQKEMFFRRRFSDPEQLHIVLSHLRSSCSLHVLCQIPVFCWITSTVLDHLLITHQTGLLPQTLTDLYIHFLLVQMHRKRKYTDPSSPSELTSGDRELLLKLGKLALEHLQKGNLMFYQEDLEKVGLDLIEASVHSGLCSQVFKQESVIFNSYVYSFVHLSVQEFMAALYLHFCFSFGHKEELQSFLGDWDNHFSLHVFLRKALKKSFESPNGHLDLLVRFLHGLCIPSNRRLLGALLGPTNYSTSSVNKVICYLNFMNTECIPPDRSVNIFHCLNEMKDSTSLQEIMKIRSSWDMSRKVSEKVSGICCSALGYMMQMSEEVLEELDVRKINSSNEGRRRLLPAVRNCTRAILCDLHLDASHFAVVCSALTSRPSHLRVLDLSQNQVRDLDLVSLCDALQSPNCRLRTLSLRGCGLTNIDPLLTMLKSHPSLRDVDLRENHLKSQDKQKLKELKDSAAYSLEVLRLDSKSAKMSRWWNINPT